MTILLLLSFGLAMDAFAVALSQGCARRPGIGPSLVIAAAFGIAQAVMPAIGYGVSLALEGVIEAVDHWIAFILLSVLGLKMIREAFGDGEAAEALRGLALFTAAVATSVDAAAAGITLPLLELPLLMSCAVIGLVTFVLSFAGARFGAALGDRFGRGAEVAGGLVLIALGVRILVEHLSA